jgi:hypothetical protein
MVGAADEVVVERLAEWLPPQPPTVRATAAAAGPTTTTLVQPGDLVSLSLDMVLIAIVHR